MGKLIQEHSACSTLADVRSKLGALTPDAMTESVHQDRIDQRIDVINLVCGRQRKPRGRVYPQVRSVAGWLAQNFLVIAVDCSAIRHSDHCPRPAARSVFPDSSSLALNVGISVLSLSIRVRACLASDATCSRRSLPVAICSMTWHAPAAVTGRARCCKSGADKTESDSR